MNENTFFYDSDSASIDFGEDGAPKLTSTSQHPPEAKRQRTSRTLPHPEVFDSTTEESDVDVQVHISDFVFNVLIYIQYPTGFLNLLRHTPCCFVRITSEDFRVTKFSQS